MQAVAEDITELVAERPDLDTAPRDGRGAEDGTSEVVTKNAAVIQQSAGHALDDAPSLSPEIVTAIYRYIDQLVQGRKILKPNVVEHLKAFLIHLFAERNRRALEMRSPEIAEAAEITNDLFPCPPYALLCIDGRVTITNSMGMFGRMRGGSMQLPAGDSRDFLQSESGELFLVPESRLHVEIDQALKKDSTVVELLDSHLGCAARHEQEDGLGNATTDSGLLADVKRKKEIAGALYLYGTSQSGKEIIPIQGQFDPHTGFAYTGLEKDDVIEHGEHNGGFTETVLQELVASGRILSTKEIATEYNSHLETEWQMFDPKPDWKNLYKETAVQFWRAMKRLSKRLLPEIKNKILTLYPALEEGKELEMRALLLLANTFSGFCNNHEGQYQFGEHRESFVSVTPSDFGPFKKYMGFRVYDGHLRRLGGDVVFAGGIVRKNRAEGRVEKPPHYEITAEFRAAPVTVVVKEVLRDPAMTEERWEKVAHLDWAFLEQVDWAHMTDDKFALALYHANPEITIGTPLQIALGTLRKKMKQLYYPYNASNSAEQLVNGKLVALPVICDSDRGFRMVVPFSRRGFTDQDVNGLGRAKTPRV